MLHPVWRFSKFHFVCDQVWSYDIIFRCARYILISKNKTTFEFNLDSEVTVNETKLQQSVQNIFVGQFVRG